jgi:type VI secretion system secreted protein VgrG
MSAASGSTDFHLSIDLPNNAPLLIKSLVGSEKISAPFSIELELLADTKKGDDNKIKPQNLIGGNTTVTIAWKDVKRNFNGIISRFWQFHRDDRFAYYRAEVVPQLWLLQLSSNCRVFQNKTVPEIVKSILSGASYPGLQFDDRLTQDKYAKLDYCVQYRETDLNFVSRLMEREGICYFFEHNPNHHVLILADAPEDQKPCPTQSSVRYLPAGGYGERENCVLQWQLAQELHSGKYSLRDFNFQIDTQTSNLEVSESTVNKVGGNDKYEMYDYPGRYAQRFNEPKKRLDQIRKEGEKFVRLRMEEEETPYVVANGTSDCRSFTAGHFFTLTHHERSEFNDDYLLTSVQYSAQQSPSYISREVVPNPYRNSFSCVRHKIPFRPPWISARPVVGGPQTAIVVGPDGEEIYTDEFGRVKVQFHWDRANSKPDERSCWIRVAHPWAGTKWGGIWIPRVGQEVIVHFLEGDPDRPIITGCVYNASHEVPYTLPDNKTRSTLKSRSTKNGSSSNYNELRFEDKKGDEQIFMNAERDMDLRVEHDSREFVGNDRSLIVQNDQKEKVQGEQDIQIAKDQNESVGGDASLNITGNQNVQVGQTMSLQVGQNLQETSGQNYAHEAGMEIHLKAGMNVVIEAGLELTIMASGNFINIGPAGIAISGTLVLINSGGAAGSGSPSSPTSPKTPKDPDTADDGSKGGKM